MDKYYSYTDFLKAVGHSKVDEEEKLLNEIYLDLFLNRIQRIHREEQLIVLIDRALDEKDEKAFYLYATELEVLHQVVSE
ncbi:IDEAL domain-containing protein [Lysinibacillus sp. NPDC048646]|uniref:IDEAL domain-containing protein n=1 Tax=Lysinibacillus sp. NPDC048646 TaxID=3390574 RepID=UPI003D0945B6